MDKFQETYNIPRLNQEKNRKVIYRFSAILIKISSGIFQEILQTILKFVWTAEDSKQSKKPWERAAKLETPSFLISNSIMKI